MIRLQIWVFFVVFGFFHGFELWSCGIYLFIDVGGEKESKKKKNGLGI